MSPKKIASIEEEKLRRIVLSYSKIRYLKNLAHAILDDRLHLDDFERMENDEIANALTDVKGIGKWTTEMFLIFSLS